MTTGHYNYTIKRREKKMNQQSPRAEANETKRNETKPKTKSQSSKATYGGGGVFNIYVCMYGGREAVVRRERSM